jgi:hypothetical protein
MRLMYCLNALNFYFNSLLEKSNHFDVFVLWIHFVFVMLAPSPRLARRAVKNVYPNLKPLAIDFYKYKQ